jgi:hypothetical protein
MEINFLKIFEQFIDSFSELPEDLAIGLCPLCRSACKAFSANLQSGAYRCFSCGASGNLINFLENILGSENKALEFLAQPAVGQTDDETDRQNESGDASETVCTYQEGVKMSEDNPEHGFFFNAALYRSQAFLSLNKNSIKVLIALYELKSELATDEIEAGYNHFENEFGISRSSLSGVFDELMAKGFVELIHKGGSKKSDVSRYRLSDAYTGWKLGTAPIFEKPKRSKADSKNQTVGAEKQNSHYKLGASIGSGFRALRKSLGSILRKGREYGFENTNT